MEFKKCVFTLGFCIDGSKVQSVKTVKLVKWEPQMESSKSPVTVTPEPPLERQDGASIQQVRTLASTGKGGFALVRGLFAPGGS